MSVRENLLKIKSSLPPHVTLVAVSKTHPAELVMEAYDAGQKVFGENKVQELSEKSALLPKDIEWHLIGHLQTNKVKYIAPYISLIHSVDSMKLLEEINKQGKKYKRVIDCLFQIYIADEETKFGLSYEECGSLLNSNILTHLPNIKIRGLMGMASNTEDEKKIRNEFRTLKQFFDKMKQGRAAEFSILSMGMSSDYKIAIEEGSTMIRIGSTVFGHRNYDVA
jgi:PLP dependent protein